MYLKCSFLLLLITFGNSLHSQNLTKDYLDSFSNRSLQIHAYHESTYLWSGTAFIFQTRSKKNYIVTNNHILGAEYEIWQYRHQHHDSTPPRSRIPTHIVIRFYATDFGKFITRTIALHESSIIKFWIDGQKPDSSTLLDVVALPIDNASIPFLSHTWLVTLNDFSERVGLYPGLDLFVVGFPADSQGYAIETPVWKKGSIASEPNLINIGEPRFLIDATTRAGMSGSPVYFRGQISSWGNNNFWAGPVQTALVGIYSAQYYQFELGRVTRLDKILTKLDTLAP